ncbi:3-isopropylmalate dehydrogenase [Ascosphaera pollenicola]|nr:3-isopropylmalate dehydrogenase [Ascosphaera pollenicola]
MPRQNHHRGARNAANMDGRDGAGNTGRARTGIAERPIFDDEAIVEETDLDDAPEEIEEDEEAPTEILDENDMVDNDEFVGPNGRNDDGVLDNEVNIEDDGQEDIELGDAEDDEGEEGDNEEAYYDDENECESPPIASNLREISSLASWQLSSHKPGCGISALRSSSTAQYWQSDGPQPHTLTLHFFKRVEIVRMRVYLDFALDESYTPTKMEFYAGMGGNDFVEFAVWQGTSPRGWVDINLEGVGGNHEKMRGHKKRKAQGADNPDEADEQNPRRRKTDHHESSAGQAVLEEGDTIEESQSHSDASSDDSDHMDISESSDNDSIVDESDPTTGNVLKAMVIQMRIVGNHQNGKDSHVRGFQVFARDERRAANAPTAADKGDQRVQSVELTNGGDDTQDEANARQHQPSFLERYFMPEPEIR